MNIILLTQLLLPMQFWFEFIHIQNKMISGGACTAAAFLSKFIDRFSPARAPYLLSLALLSVDNYGP